MATALVGAHAYQLWQQGPWEIPSPTKKAEPVPTGTTETKPQSPPPVNTKVIIDRNLFDPERGAGQTKDGEASSVSIQRISRLILVGTAILGTSRYAILQEPLSSPASGPRGQVGTPTLLRLKLGDTLEGFNLSEINEKGAVFTKGASRVEVRLDFSRKVEEPRPPVPAPPPPRPAAPPRPPGPQPRVAPVPQPAR